MTERSGLNMIRLAAELVTSPPDPQGTEWLSQGDINVERFKTKLGLFRRRVVFNDDEFDISPMGDDAFLHIVRDPQDRIIDIVAWPTGNPGYFARWFGDAGLLVGDGDSLFVMDRVHLWPSPFDYALAGCEGAVVIDLDTAIPALKQHPGKLVVPSFSHARELSALGVSSTKILIRKEAIAA